MKDKLFSIRFPSLKVVIFMARIDKITNEVKREAANIIASLKDPRIPDVVSRDLSYATIYVSMLGTDEQRAEALKGLNSAKSYVRRELGRRVKLRITPEVIFKLDDSMITGSHIFGIINSLDIPPAEEETEEEEEE